MRTSPRSGPQSPASNPTNSPSAAMPRISFSLRSPPASPPRPPPNPNAVIFSGTVWMPTEPSFFTFGLGSKWAKTSLVMWTASVAEDAAGPMMLHLQLGDRAVVVATAIHTVRTTDLKKEKRADKQQVRLDVKTPGDIRRAVLYHTAAMPSPLSFYVDGDALGNHIVDLIHHTLASQQSPVPPHVVRLPSPPIVPSGASIPAVDDAFAQLEVARAKHQRGHVVDALAAYATANHTFATVNAQSNVDESQRTRIIQSRKEIQSAIQALEMEKSLPRSTTSVTTTTVDVSEPPSSTQTTQSTTISARLEDLQAFAHTRDVQRAQRERNVSTDDLTLRLQALRNETSTAPSIESLQERLERLRGGSTPPIGVDTAARTTTTTLSAVDEIIQQAMDEVALGLVDESDDDDVASCYSSDDSDVDSESDSDQHRRHRRRP